MEVIKLKIDWLSSLAIKSPCFSIQFPCTLSPQLRFGALTPVFAWNVRFPGFWAEAPGGPFLNFDVSLSLRPWEENNTHVGPRETRPSGCRAMGRAARLRGGPSSFRVRTWVEWYSNASRNGFHSSACLSGSHTEIIAPLIILYSYTPQTVFAREGCRHRIILVIEKTEGRLKWRRHEAVKAINRACRGME